MVDLLAPLPLRPDAAAAPSEARFVRFDREDPRWCEPMVDLGEAGLLVEAWYARRDGGNAPYGRPIAGAVDRVWARRSVADRLRHADALVSTHGFSIKIVDAWRPVETQAGLWSFFWDKLGGEHPDLDEADLEALVRTFVSDPRRFNPEDDTTWPIHSTGGSVDVMLVERASGAMLDHGAGFDEAHERSYTDHCERQLAVGLIAAEDDGLLNRRRLVNAMLAAGFTNYAYEFWHFDFGTQLYALTLAGSTGAGAAPKAWYGTTRP